MVYFQPPSKRLLQPRGAVRIDWNSPFASGMVGLAYCGSGPSVELVNRNQFSGASYAKDTLAPSVDYVGVGRKSTSTGVGCISGGRTAWTNWWLPGPLTFSCYWNLITNPSGSVNIAGAQGGGGGYVLWNHYGTNRAFAVAGGVAEDGSDFITGIPALASGVYNKANVKLYDGGVLRATSGSVTADATYPSPGFMTVFCGGNGDNSAYFDGTLYWMGLWNRARSTEEESELNRYPFAFLSSDPRRIYFGAGGAAGETGLVLSDAAQGHAADAVVLSAASSLAVADATHAHSAETPTIDVSTATPLTVADATQAQSSDAATLTTASSISVADATQGQSADAADLTSAHALTVADATQGQASEMPTLDTSNATPLTIADSTHGHVAGNLALLAACLLATQGATQAQQTDSVDLVTLHHLAAADATHAMSSESPTLTIPGTGTGATVEEIVAAMMAALNATAIPVNIEQVNAVPLTGVGSDGDPWRAA